MKFNIKELLWLLAMGLFYVAIGIMGSWFPVIYILACIFGIPFSLYVYKKGIKFSSFLMPVVVMASIVFIRDERTFIMLLLLLFIPSFLCGIYYHKQKNLPKNIIMLSIAYLFGWIGILIIWRFVYCIGIIPEYFSLTNTIEAQFLKEMSNQYELLLSNIQNTSKASFYAFGEDANKLLEDYSLYRQAIKQSFYLVKYLFPTFIFIFGFFSSIVQVLLTKLILKAFRWESPSMKEITNIGFTPLTVFFLGITWMFRGDMDNLLYPDIIMAVDNVLVIFSLFMFIVGIMFTIYVIRNAKAGAGFKVLVGILSFLSIIISPFLFVLLGFFEGIFNFRKTERFL